MAKVKQYISLYSENNITIWGTYDDRHENIINEIVITKDNKKIYFTGNNLYVNIENLANEVENIIFLINNIDTYNAVNTTEYLNNLLEAYFYNSNSSRFTLAIKRIKAMINEQNETKKHNAINEENKTLLTQITSIASTKQILVYNLYSTVILLTGASREFSRDMIKNLYETKELYKLKDYGINYQIFEDINYNCRYGHETENLLYKDVLNKLTA